VLITEPDGQTYLPYETIRSVSASPLGRVLQFHLTDGRELQLHWFDSVAPAMTTRSAPAPTVRHLVAAAKAIEEAVRASFRDASSATPSVLIE